MAIPVYLQQFKAAGVYRVVFDKSTMTNIEPETLRLVVGYSEVGPFNCPVYVKDQQEFVQYFGNISKKLEKRGVYFHRMCLQMLSVSPIICLNLKKFSGETIGASTISTEFNANYDPIDDVKINLEDIFDKTRFWEISADQLNDLNSVDGITLNNYINLSMTDTYANSVSYFIRKASGSVVSQYNVTVNDWYADRADEKPEYLEDYGNLLISDFFAEIYVFKGKFKSTQVLASDSLKKYFVATDELDYEDPTNKNYILKLRSNLHNAYGELVDTLDALYADPASNAIGHWVGCLIPYFTDKRGNYQALDIVFNQDNDVHKMMMSFNIDLLEEYNTVPIDLSGKLSIPVSSEICEVDGITNGVSNAVYKNPLSLETIYQGVARTNLLGNLEAPVIADRVSFYSSIDKKFNQLQLPDLTSGRTFITGSLYVSSIVECADDSNLYDIILRQIRPLDGEDNTVSICKVDKSNLENVLTRLGVTNFVTDDAEKSDKYILTKTYKSEIQSYEIIVNKITKTTIADGTFWYWNGNDDTDKVNDGWNFEPFKQNDTNYYERAYWGPSKIITAIRRLENRIKGEDLTKYSDIDNNFICSFTTVTIQSHSEATFSQNEGQESLYGPSVSFIETSGWNFTDAFELNGGIFNALYTNKQFDTSLQLVLKNGDCLIANDGTIDTNHDNIIDDNDKNKYLDNVYVQDMGVKYDENGNFVNNYILLSGAPIDFDGNYSGVGVSGWQYDSRADGEQSKTDTDNGWDWNDSSYDDRDYSNRSYLIRIDAPLNQEIGTMIPHYVEGYVYKNIRPNGTDMYSKLQWQKFILSTLTAYSGLRKGLLDKANIDYRYVVDTFESFPQSELKNELSRLCMDKESAFCIANLPAVKTFVKCPYISFTDENGVFSTKYVVAGRNRKKPAVESFSLPSESEGASFIGMYTPLKFSDGYVDSIIPSAGLVSNLFIDKYMSRQPYNIVAGPNYGNIVANGLVGPDYKFSRDELYDLEPMGFNCMIYRPSFGTFINANQTAKQTPLSALSRINVRELVIYLQDEIEKVLQSYQWEFNNQTTRNAILDKANQICAVIKANGGIQTYLNIMDESNNTPEIIDNEMAVLSTHIEPGFGCGKMVHELTLYRTGQMSSVITD